MGARRARTRVLLFLIAGAASAALGLAGYATNIFGSLELQSVDERFAIRGHLAAPPGVVVVAIDANSFGQFQAAKMPSRWPWPRRYEASVISRVAAAHPVAIAVDIQFTEPSDPRDDNALIEAVAKAHDVVLATTEVGRDGSTDVFGGNAAKFGARVGNASLPTDPDGVIRHVPEQTDGLETFGLVAAEIANREPVQWPGGKSQWIDFAGPPGTVNTYSFSDVYFGHVPPSAFRDKVVIIGPSAPTLQDVHATSAAPGEQMPGAEIQANIVDTALEGFPLRNAPSTFNVAVILLFGLLPAAASLRLRALAIPLIAVVIGALYAALAQVGFDHGRIVSFTYPVGALALSAVACIMIWYVLEAIERAVTRDTFARFVPAAVVDQVLARTHGELRLGGEQVVGSVMFTDLRGFTTFSESAEAEQLIEVLNRYLSAMTDAVLAHGGTLVTYTGDGMMAVFGAPLEQTDHADRALATAREMLEERLPSFNAWLHEQGIDRGFSMGIGINTGPFIAGNVGSEQRLEYTAIGDTINTASRIEGMTKGTPYALFLADSTRDALTRDADALVYVDELAVRGRQAAIKLWTLEGDAVLKSDWQSEKGAPEPLAG